MKKSIPGQLSLYDIMDRRSLLRAGDEIESDSDIKELIGDPIEEASDRKGDLAWVRYDLTSGTIYELNRIVGADDTVIMLSDGTACSRALREKIDKIHPNGFLYNIKAA